MQSQSQNPRTNLRERTFKFGLRLIKFLEGLETRQSVRIVSSQLIRSATSVGANIVEAKGSSSKREFLNYFQIALKSCFETEYWLELVQELVPGKRTDIETLRREAHELSKILSSSVLTMKGKTRV